MSKLEINISPTPLPPPQKERGNEYYITPPLGGGRGGAKYFITSPMNSCLWRQVMGEVVIITTLFFL